jgi:hypothetical protein
VSRVPPMNRTRPSQDEEGEEVDSGLVPSTAPPRLEDSGSKKMTRGRTLDFVALHTGAASITGKP